jgi:protoheme ferro-lyase
MIFPVHGLPHTTYRRQEDKYSKYLNNLTAELKGSVPALKL